MLGQYLIEKYGFQRYAFGDPVKEVCRHLFGFNDEQLYGSQKEDMTLIGITPREAFQKIGTNFGRQQIHDLFPTLNIKHGQLWIHAFHSFIENSKDSPLQNTKYVITDVRFENEAEAIRVQGGKIIYIDSLYSNKEDTHESEQINVSYDYVLVNDGSKEDAYKKLDDILCII